MKGNHDLTQAEAPTTFAVLNKRLDTATKKVAKQQRIIVRQRREIEDLRQQVTFF